MQLHVWPALIGGSIGGAAMSMMAMLMRRSGLGLQLNISRMWGTMVGLHGAPARAVGMLIHLAVSALIGLTYAWGFTNIFHARDRFWQWGLVGGVIHWFLAGLFMAIVPPLHPELPERRPAPGAFVKNYGMPDVPAFLMAHLVYGAIVGAIYGRRQPTSQAPVSH